MIVQPGEITLLKLTWIHGRYRPEKLKSQIIEDNQSAASSEKNKSTKNLQYS